MWTKDKNCPVLETSVTQISEYSDPPSFGAIKMERSHSYRIGISGTRHTSYAIRFLKTTQCRISLKIQGIQLERNNSNCNPFVCTVSLQYYLNRLIQNTTGKKKPLLEMAKKCYSL